MVLGNGEVKHRKVCWMFKLDTEATKFWEDIGLTEDGSLSDSVTPSYDTSIMCLIHK